MNLDDTKTLREKQERLKALQRERAMLERYLRIQRYAASYGMRWEFPATVGPFPDDDTEGGKSGGSSEKGRGLRTDAELIQHRLLEAGVLFDMPVTIGDTVGAASKFVADLESTDCFERVRVKMGQRKPTPEEGGESRQERLSDVMTSQPEKSKDEDDDASATAGQLRVLLEEKRWYRLHAGGGIRTDDFLVNPERAAGAEAGFLPAAELDVSIGLRNLEGRLDRTDLSYMLDTKGVGTWCLSHERPLYAAFPNRSILGDYLLQQPAGSQYYLQARAAVDTVDYEWTRRYREFQRLLSLRACNRRTGLSPLAAAASGTEHAVLEWSLQFRDLVPARHAEFPHAFAASPAVVSAAGPSVKHSLTAEWNTAGAYADHPTNPTAGSSLHFKAEWATPPGDVGFFKAVVGGSFHLPVVVAEYEEQELPSEQRGLTKTAAAAATSLVSLHASLHSGLLHSLSFGGLCRPAGLSDRFYVGGPLQLRGFSPAGIGPRAPPGPASLAAHSSAVGPGDAIGGDFFYTATAMASVAPSRLAGGALLASLSDGNAADSLLRLFCFVNAGTCVGAVAQTPLSAILWSTRCSAGVGLATAALGPRCEVTYSYPLRAGPRDVRKSFQFGLGFSFG